ncbi:uncharacterized protein LOC121387258 [Gigantopelta aegis]|uniref:uncharacterized protein LOC121387258 n=1 Tax=Gigantopelta aegis TaxID=1735272 RepID=UPI001B88D5EF|nr:uncharacterized protein LOC121387258 [Gigantopelta aegis]
MNVNKRYIMWFLGVSWLFLCIAYYLPTSMYLSFVQLHHEACPDVLGGMMSGTWKTRELTSQEQTEIDTFIKFCRKYLPDNYQRSDLKCGNLPYKKTGFRVWFRVLCNPNGPTPCCFKYRCENKTVDECRGPKTFDLRNRVHAEYSKWQPTDKRCPVKIFDSQSACNLLKGSTIYIFGDSLMRQFYTSLLLIIRGDLKTGALKANTPKEKRKQCSGMYIYTHYECGGYIDFQPKVCNASLKLKFRYYTSVKSNQKALHDALQLKGKKKSMLVLGIGLWDYFNYSLIVNAYLDPIVQALVKPRNSSYNGWPKILWSAAQSLGVFRYPHVKTVDNLHGKQFNVKMAAYLRNFNIPIFNAFNMTDGVTSIDGTHYGIGLNMWKARIYLNYIQELKDKGLW